MQAIEEQVYTIERALGERMVKHALFVVRLWLNELGEDNPFEDAYRSLFVRYDDFFADWVVAGDGEQDEVLETMTSEHIALWMQYMQNCVSNEECRLKCMVSTEKIRNR